MSERERGPIKYEIVKKIGVLNSYPTGWNKELNVVRWNDKSEKYDVRDWSPGHERMSRGVTLYEGELKKLMELCSGLFDRMPAEKAEAVKAVEAVEAANAVSAAAEQPADKVAEAEVPF